MAPPTVLRNAEFHALNYLVKFFFSISDLMLPVLADGGGVRAFISFLQICLARCWICLKIFVGCFRYEAREKNGRTDARVLLI